MPEPQPGASCSRAGATAVVQTLPPCPDVCPCPGTHTEPPLWLYPSLVALGFTGELSGCVLPCAGWFLGTAVGPFRQQAGGSLLQRGNLGLRMEQAHAPWLGTPL